MRRGATIMITKQFTVNIPEFDEARPVAEIVQTASQFKSELFLIFKSREYFCNLEQGSQGS